MAKQIRNPKPIIHQPAAYETPVIGIEAVSIENLKDAIHFSNIPASSHQGIAVYAGSQIPKSSDLFTAQKAINSTFNGFIICKSPKAKSAILSQIVTGVDAADIQAKFVVISKNCLQQLISSGDSFTNLFELIYVLKKTTASEYIVHLGAETQSVTFKNIFSCWLKASLNYFFRKNKNVHRWVFLFLSIFGFVFMTQMSKTASISGDEFTQYTYSKLIANYYLEPMGMGIPIDTNELKGQRMPTLAKELPNLGSNLATIKDPDRLMHLYGSSFDTFTTILGHWLGVDDYMNFRHYWNAIFGFLVILFTGLTIRRISNGNWLFAWVGMLMIMLMPRFFGEALNNPKDVPFALGYIMSLYYAIKMFQSWPNFRWNAAIGLVLGTALGISVRIGGLLSIAIFCFYAGLKFIEHIGYKKFLKFQWVGFTKMATTLLLLGLASYILGIFFWPYGWDQPMNNPMDALKEFTNYSVSLRQLFEGKLYDSDMLPSTYLVKYLMITTPLAVMAGLGLFVLLFYRNRKKINNEIFLILFAAIFPIVYIFIQKSQVYGGIRQILFTLPCFAIIAVTGYQWFADVLSRVNRNLYWVSTIIALLLMLMPAKFILVNHPLSYSYFNEYFGGTKKAYGEFEMDYYLASLRPSADWFIENVARKNPQKKYEVLSYGMDHVKYYCRNEKNVHVGYSRFDDRSSKKWDYCIFYNAYFDKARLNSGEFPPKGTIYKQLVDGVAAGVVVERLGLDDFEGIKAIEKDNEFAKGIEYLTRYLKKDPSRSEICFYLSTAYANLGQLDKAIGFAKRARTYFPEHSKSCFALWQYYMNKKDYEAAMSIMTKYLDYRPKDGEGFVMKAQAQLTAGNIVDGMTTIKEAIGINPMDYRLYSMGSQVYQMKKDASNYNLWLQASTLANPKSQADIDIAVESIKMIYEELTGNPLDTKKYGLEQ